MRPKEMTIKMNTKTIIKGCYQKFGETLATYFAPVALLAMRTENDGLNHECIKMTSNMCTCVLVIVCV